MTRGQLILHTHVDMFCHERPTMAIYFTAELNGDATNWWRPNACCVEGMMKAAGFTKVEAVGLSAGTRIESTVQYGMVSHP